MSEIWDKIDLLKFGSDEFGVIYRDPETGEWVQDHPSDGERNLKVLTLRDAMEKGTTPYKKKKVPKVKKAKASKKVSTKLKEPKKTMDSKKLAKTILKGKNVRQRKNL